MNASRTWHADTIGDNWHVLSKTGYVIAKAGPAYNEKTRMENMMLCAAAPDLLDALQATLAYCESGAIREQALAAIAKAAQ